MKPMLVIWGMLIVALVALGFLSNSFDPFTASMEVKALFLLAVFILAVSASLIVLYAIAIGWHNGMQYFFARYFGAELPYFKSTFRRSVLVSILFIVMIGLRRFGYFSQYFAGGAALIIILLELFYSAHDKQVEPKS